MMTEIIMTEDENNTSRRLARKRINRLTEGVFSTLTDLLLYSFYLPLCSFGKRKSSRDIYRTFNEADELLKKINYKKFKHSFQVLRRNGLVESIVDWSLRPKITAAGKKRLGQMIPEYNSKRPWNGKLYLISYDFPIQDNKTRDLFRSYIKRLGTVKLQESLYLSFDSFYELISDFQKRQNYKGIILISELSQKGFLGKNDIKSFIWQVSGLEQVNRRYQEFIRSYKQGISKKSLLHFSLEYYSILEDDPQIPFELLPDQYLGDEAYLLFKQLTKKKLPRLIETVETN